MQFGAQLWLVSLVIVSVGGGLLDEKAQSASLLMRPKTAPRLLWRLGCQRKRTWWPNRARNGDGLELIKRDWQSTLVVCRRNICRRKLSSFRWSIPPMVPSATSLHWHSIGHSTVYLLNCSQLAHIQWVFFCSECSIALLCVPCLGVGTVGGCCEIANGKRGAQIRQDYNPK